MGAARDMSNLVGPRASDYTKAKSAEHIKLKDADWTFDEWKVSHFRVGSTGCEHPGREAKQSITSKAGIVARP